MNTFIDLELSTMANSDSQVIRMSPSVLAEILETYQRMALKQNKNLFGALMGKVSTEGSFLVSSVVCLNYNFEEQSSDKKEVEVIISKGWKEHIGNHEQLYGEKCLSTFIVNPPAGGMVVGLLTTAMSGYKRSKLDAQVADLLVNIHIDEQDFDYSLQAFKIVKNKYFSKSFATMHRMRVVLDYIPEPAQHDFYSLFFFQLRKHDYHNFESQLLADIIEKVERQDEESQDTEGDFEFDEDGPIPMTEEVLQTFEAVFGCRRRWDAQDLGRVREDVEGDIQGSSQIRKALELQIKVAQKIATDSLNS